MGDLMLRTMLRSKIHRAKVTQADLNYEGSITVDTDLLDAALMVPFEKVSIYNVTSGTRLSTYVIPGIAGSGKICINGAAARLVKVDDVVIICCYGEFNEEEVENHSAQIVLVDDQNKITRNVEKSRTHSPFNYSTVTLLARLRGLSTSQPRSTAM